jgi:hypothetical protein
VTDGNDHDFLLPHPVVDAIGKPSNGPNPNLATLNASCQGPLAAPPPLHGEAGPPSCQATFNVRDCFLGVASLGTTLVIFSKTSLCLIQPKLMDILILTGLEALYQTKRETSSFPVRQPSRLFFDTQFIALHLLTVDRPEMGVNVPKVTDGLNLSHNAANQRRADALNAERLYSERALAAFAC